MEEKHMPLAMVVPGEQRRILECRGKEEMRKHLNNLGFVRGETVQVVGDSPSGMILAIKGVRIALNRGLANMIMVV
jgi:ferrous iron transport protein A